MGRKGEHPVKHLLDYQGWVHAALELGVDMKAHVPVQYGFYIG
ncbi:MAG: hypothetical protein ABGW81_00455 [Paracoccaceae bacterium]